MRTKKDRGAALRFVFILGSLIATEVVDVNGQSNNCRIVVGEDALVSQEQQRIGERVFETYVAVNPQNKNNLIAAAMRNKKNTPFPADSVFYYSLDAGKTWKQPLLNGKPLDHDSSTDPIVAFSKSGTAFFMTMAVGGTNSGGNYMYRSLNGGRTVNAAQQISRHSDHWMPGTDLGDGKYGGSTYAFALAMDNTCASRGPKLELLRTRSEGQDWTRLEVTTAFDLGLFKVGEKAANGLQTANSGALVSRAGKLFLFFRSFEFGGSYDGRGFNWMVTSADGGESFAKPTRLLTRAGEPILAISPHPGGKGEQNWSSFAIDSSGGPFKDRLYSAWMEPSPNMDKYRMLFSFSSDEGKSWREPEELNVSRISEMNTNLQRSALLTLTVNNRGVLLLTFYTFAPQGDFSLDASGKRTRSVNHRRYAMASFDGGATFTDPIPIASISSQFDSTLTKDVNYGEMETAVRGGKIALLDYLNTTSGPDGTFHTQWMDSRNGIQQMWYAPVRVDCVGKNETGSSGSKSAGKQRK